MNPSQREAVTHPGGPLLIVAGAGAGKTRVLTRRAGWLGAGGLVERTARVTPAGTLRLVTQGNGGFVVRLTPGARR